jgi:hypothetical protein
MNKENMLSTLEGMAEGMENRWRETLDERDTQFAQSYAQICQAITALNAPKPFVQIGANIINRADIIRVEIKEFNSYYNEPKHVRVYTRDVYGGESYGSTTNYVKFPFDSPEANAILAWLKDQTEVVVACKDKPE